MPKHPPPATLSDVARHCRVSLATASKAFSPRAGDIGAATRERILTAARVLGFHRDRSTSVRARRRWNNIGMAWGRHAPRGDGIYDQLFETAAVTLKRWGYHLLFTPVEDVADWRRMQQAQRLDGIIAVESMPDAVLAEIEAAEYPAVLLNLASHRQLHQILPDDRGGMAALAAHLSGLGHRRAVYLPRVAWATHASDDERWAGLQAVAGDMALERADAAAAVRRCVAGTTALIGYSHGEAIAALAALRERGLAVPEQVSVVAGSDVPWLAHVQPGLTAVAIPVVAMAERAAGLVVDLIERSAVPPPGVELVAERLVVRASTAPPP